MRDEEVPWGPTSQDARLSDQLPPGSGFSVTSLHAMLRECLVKEAEQWRPVKFVEVHQPGEDICPVSRCEAVSWLVVLSLRAGWQPETAFLSVSIMDRLLATVRARRKYIRCVATACGFIAAKVAEEDQFIPSTTEMVKLSLGGCTHSEILRMERVVLDKLNWQPRLVTSLDFLHVLHALSFPGRNPTDLTRKLLRVVQSPLSLTARPSLLSLAVVVLELEMCDQEHSLSWSLCLQGLVGISTTDLDHIKEQIRWVLGSHRSVSAGLKQSSVPSTQRTPRRRRSNSHGSHYPAKRKLQSPPDLDDIYSSLRFLYGEGRAASTETEGWPALSPPAVIKHVNKSAVTTSKWGAALFGDDVSHCLMNPSRCSTHVSRPYTYAEALQRHLPVPQPQLCV